MTPPDYTKLLASLTEEHAAVRSFAALLQQEQQLLTENSIDPLVALAEQKSTLAIKLNRIAEARHRQLTDLIPNLTASAIQNWLKINCAEGLALWQAILALSDQARELNRINGELIQMKFRHNQQLLSALSRAVNQANLYGPDGQSNFSIGSGRSLGSG